VHGKKKTQQVAEKVVSGKDVQLEKKQFARYSRFRSVPIMSDNYWIIPKQLFNRLEETISNVNKNYTIIGKRSAL
jgi:hypothetical protein